MLIALKAKTLKKKTNCNALRRYWTNGLFLHKNIVYQSLFLSLEITSI